MKEMTKKTAVVAMAGIMAAGMLTGCRSEEHTSELQSRE